MQIGFHTDAFNSSVYNFKKCVDWATENDVKNIECGVLDGVSWIHGLGYFPHLALYEDPATVREMLEKSGLKLSQIDAAYPLSGKDGPTFGVPYILKSIPWAKHAGCSNIATTDGLYKPEDLSDDEAIELMKGSYGILIETAEKYAININIEIHGYFTTKPEMLEKMLNFCDSEYLGLNLDTSNSFIAGEDPVAICKQFIHKIKHVHIKDVSKELSDAARGKDTGIGISHCAIGDGVNSSNIVKCIEILRDNDYSGVLSMEVEGQGGPMIEKSLAWLRNTLEKLNIQFS
jgi:sugar phosphate isomerase/epimerase